MSRRPSMPAWMNSWCSSGPKLGEVEHQRLVAPHQDVVRGRGDLVGERLAAGRRLGDLEQQARS